jgi:hypothetical protein
MNYIILLTLASPFTWLKGEFFFHQQPIVVGSGSKETEYFWPFCKGVCQKDNFYDNKSMSFVGESL